MGTIKEKALDDKRDYNKRHLREIAKIVWIDWHVDERRTRLKRSKYNHIMSSLQWFIACDIWSEYMTLFWGHLMYRIRSKCREACDPFTIAFLDAVYGTVLLAYIGLSEYDEFYVYDRFWASHLRIARSQVDVFKKRVLVGLNYELQVFHWSIAIQKVEELERDLKRMVEKMEALVEEGMTKGISEREKIKVLEERGEVGDLESFRGECKKLMVSLNKAIFDVQPFPVYIKGGFHWVKLKMGSQQ